MTDQPSEVDPRIEARAPGWVITCRRCGFSEPLGRVGIRRSAASRGKVTLRRCPRCRRLCCHAIRHRPDRA